LSFPELDRETDLQVEVSGVGPLIEFTLGTRIQKLRCRTPSGTCVFDATTTTLLCEKGSAGRFDVKALAIATKEVAKVLLS